MNKSKMTSEEHIRLLEEGMLKEGVFQKLSLGGKLGMLRISQMVDEMNRNPRLSYLQEISSLIQRHEEEINKIESDLEETS